MKIGFYLYIWMIALVGCNKNKSEIRLNSDQLKYDSTVKYIRTIGVNKLYPINKDDLIILASWGCLTNRRETLVLKINDTNVLSWYYFLKSNDINFDSIQQWQVTTIYDTAHIADVKSKKSFLNKIRLVNIDSLLRTGDIENFTSDPHFMDNFHDMLSLWKKLLYWNRHRLVVNDGCSINFKILFQNRYKEFSMKVDYFENCFKNNELFKLYKIIKSEFKIWPGYLWIDDLAN